MKLYLSLFALLSLVACASGPTPKSLSNTEKARLYLDVGNASLQENDPIGALQNLFIAEKLDSSIPEIHHSKALAYNARHDLNHALESAKKAIDLNPQYSDANNTYGRFLIDAGRLSEAEAPLNAAASDPIYRDAWKAMTNLGILHYRRNEFPAAEKDLKHATLESPMQSCVAHYYLGHIRMARGNFLDASKEYEAATQKFCANFADAHLALGIAYEKSGNYDRARKKFLDIRNTFANTEYSERATERLRSIP